MPAPGNARHYAQIVKQNSLLRRLLEASQRIQHSVHEREGEPAALVEQAESMLFKVAHEERASDFRVVADVLAEEIDRLEALAKGDREVTGTPSGFRDLDNLLGGFQPGNLIVLAARPSLGKSALVCNIAENVAAKAQQAGGVLLPGDVRGGARASLHRLPIADSQRPAAQGQGRGAGLATGRARLQRAREGAAVAGRFLGPQPARVARQGAAPGGEPGGSGARDRGLHAADAAEDPRVNRVEQVGQISRGLKILARELKVPVIGVSQLSRAPEQRPDKRPILSDLRESGSIEQDADVVAFIYRAAKYDEDADPSEADLIIAKHRNGPTGDVPVVFLEQYPRFVDRAGGSERPVEQKAGEGPPIVDLAEEA